MKRLLAVVVPTLAVLGGLFLVLTVFYAIADYDKNPDRVQTENVVRQGVGKSDYIGFEYEQGFLNGCTENGVTQAACQCMMDYLDANMTNEELIDMSLLSEYDMSQHPILTKAVNNCL